MTPRRIGTIGDRGGDAVPDPPVREPSVHLDAFGLLRSGDAWISLSPTQELIVRALIDNLGEVVGREQLAAAAAAAAAWPSGGPDRHAIDVHIHKLRPASKGWDW